ncbi:repeat motif-containing protein [Elysia marginata]|uniref:Repeat motif-containing protein n=1 Tax=Elysia marginata TaxID=1093978 RepID=A0AAV4JHA1_9GAST|nr:repeat motif-containing protein [Elysia marginata]
MDDTKQSVESKVDSLESNMNDKIHSLDNKMNDTKQSVESKVDSLERNMEDKIQSLDNKMDDTKQSVESKVDSLENIIHGKLDILENRIEDKIDNTNKLIQMDFKVSKELANFRQETKSDISGSLEALAKKSNKVLGKFSESFENKTSGLLVSMEDSFDSLMSRGLPKLHKDIKTAIVESIEAFKNRANEEQKKSLETFSDSVEVTLNKKLGVITSMETGFEDFIKLSQMDLASVKNETETIHDLLVEVLMVSIRRKHIILSLPICFSIQYII